MRFSGQDQIILAQSLRSADPRDRISVKLEIASGLSSVSAPAPEKQWKPDEVTPWLTWAADALIRHPLTLALTNQSVETTINDFSSIYLSPGSPPGAGLSISSPVTLGMATPSGNKPPRSSLQTAVHVLPGFNVYRKMNPFSPVTTTGALQGSYNVHFLPILEHFEQSFLK